MRLLGLTGCYLIYLKNRITAIELFKIFGKKKIMEKEDVGNRNRIKHRAF